MKKRLLKYILSLLFLLGGTGFFTLNADFLIFNKELPEIELISPQAEGDTIPPSRYPVAKTAPEEYGDIKKQYPADLRSPENLDTKVEYDIRTGQYKIVTRIGDMEVSTPLVLTPEEYQDYSFQQSLNSYFRRKNAEAFDEDGNQRFNLTDLQFDLGPAQRIFGPGGVRVRTQGTAQVTMGLKRSTTQDPTLPQSSRSRTYFNFDESVQLNVQASVGTKVNFDMNYNTETSFDFDSKKLKLAYTGDEDEIIKSLEAGNVSMTTSNSLINGGAALFGMKADLQFGKLRVKALAAQQESESRTVNSKGGAQTKDFEIPIDQYDEKRHFFLAHYFRDIFDGAMARLPNITTSIKINRIEVWVTNKTANYNSPRNIVAFSDLGETTEVSKPIYQTSPASGLPYNTANDLYGQLLTTYSDARNINMANNVLSGDFEGGKDFEKVGNARLLETSEYVLNEKLGYISLRSQLQDSEVLAVAFEYTYGGDGSGKIYKVGEFSSDNTEDTNTTLFVKLLKGNQLDPSMPFWNLMMKNVYSLGAYSVQKDRFQLDVLYQSDSVGTYLNYLPEGNLSSTPLLRVMGLDRLNSNLDAHPDGFFDFVEGYTILTDNGRIIFPRVEPFGSHLRSQINNNALAEKYVYQELYDSTLVVARQIAEKNKFILRGKYRASSASEINLGATNVARGSVRVTAGGVALTENSDYTVDYISGVVTIINENIINSGTNISVSLENQSVYSMQRKTMLGLDLNYDFSDKLTLGGTIMHLSEMPLTTKTTYGDESIKNTLWGANLSYKSESQMLTNMLDKIPLLSLTKPSHISFDAEFAHLIAGHYENKYTGAYSYIDDFESAQSGFDLSNPYSWQIASTPYQDVNPLFPEASKTNDVEYGMNRALFAWYYIDGMFTRKNSNLMPQYMKQNKDFLSNHYSRAITYQELYPNKDMQYNESSTLQVLNVAYYPEERGPYNVDVNGTNPDGTLSQPEKRWGGMMRKIDQSNFETANVEYIEFWLMDPFVYNPTGDGGDLYFNLGEISEDILKDGKKFFENGLPADGDLSKVDTTVWGRVPKLQNTVYAFDNSDGSLKLQDVGLDGLASGDEKTFPTYRDFLQQLQNKVDASVWSKWQVDPFSPVNDPSGDDFHHYRGADYDDRQLDILSRYKRYNGTEGNSSSNEDSSESYNTAAKKLPDVEDINQDYTLDEYEKYYEYKVSLKPVDLEVGKNHIVDRRTYHLTLENGTPDSVTWYQFKIPVKQYDRSIGNIRDFNSIRFMRMYMTGFKDETFLRFGSFQLVRGDWRTYEQDLYGATNGVPAVDAQMEVFTVNIEENSQKDPVNYVLPPGVTRMLDPSQPQLTRQNEQSLAMKILGLAPQDARAIYKTTSYDFRQYKRLQLFTHAEAIEMDTYGAAVEDQEFSAFIRLGSDYKNNYYEYEIPLKITPKGNYSSDRPADQYIVWPESNMMDFRFEALTELKMARNRASRQGSVNVNYNTVFSEPDPDNAMNKISVIGNPSLAEVKVIMIGVRNNSSQIKSVEVWVNELRLTDFDEDGGWAANASLNVALSDLGTVNLGGRIETAGFGGLDQSLNERRMEDYTQFNVSTSLELGKLFPEKAKVSIPFYYSYYEEKTKPKYNPLDQDILLSTSLKEAASKAEKDSILNLAQDKVVTKSIAVNNVRVDIKSENPMPYDPANFTVSYSYSETTNTSPETDYETTKDYRGSFAYSYTPYVKPFQPFRKIKGGSATAYFRQLKINYVPNNINFLTTMTRNYYELQLRDLAAIGNNSGIPVSFSQNFYWDRAFGMRWDFTNNLRTTFNSGTNARIEEPYVQVNRKLNPDDYQVWKDSVWRSIRDLGRPLAYDQTFTATYNLPFQHMPVLAWIVSSATYRATYTWDRIAVVEDEYGENRELGNTIQNQRTIDFQNSLNFLTLYNKNKYLRSVNQKFNQTGGRNTGRPQGKRQPVKVEKEVTLSPDSNTYLTHGIMSNRVQVIARGADGRKYAVKYKVVNLNQIVISNRDTATLQVSVTSLPPKTEEKWYKYAEYGSRVLMMVRRLNVSYAMTDGMTLPGFRPEVGDIFGQKKSSVGMAPGLDFAFGRVNRSYIDKARENDWLVYNYENISPAYLQTSKNLTASVGLEPWNGLKIDLNANHLHAHNTEIQYMFDGMPELYGGQFIMTTVAAGSALKGIGSLSNGYKSADFEKFVNYRTTVAGRYEQLYAGARYPSSGYMAENVHAGENYIRGSVSENATDVLIPAFLAAYTGKDPNKIALTPFPSISSMLPNWSIRYDGLTQIPFIKKYFKTLLLSHAYRGAYNVSGYSSHASWTRLDGELGFIPGDTETSIPTPSSPYNISSVTISDGFSPLVGVDGTLLSNVTLGVRYNTMRSLNLSMAAYQIVESHTKEFSVGLGYKMTEFNKILNIKSKPDFSNDLDVRLDFSYRKTLSLNRKIQDMISELTSGNVGKMIQFSANYAMSRSLTMRAFFDMQINNPLLSSTAYPTTNSSFGISMIFSLTQ